MHRTCLLITGFGLAWLAAGTPALAEPAVHRELRPAALGAAKAGHPKNKGNSRNRGNYRSKGKSINSGNFSNVIGSYKSNNSYSGSGNTVNGPQRLIVRPRAH
ncbi:hypothetical protein OUY22_33575 [Nonomuraea sp. MCN248]|uniref:Uncharacterized protein n=1 Tax=Nonomuraea corallina TaxID=2989783 RepID=A0ABT4SM88_9ACTN|nr:hypothetical protein [Nonomuraea corallina]MDA0638363.1 hypothetical protein [Nonomuraea corallina]